MSQTTLISIPSPSVSIHSGRPATTSLEVAKFFGKRHDHVVRDIDNLLTQLPENFLQPNFGESVYEQETPIGTKQARMFILYRDGFMLLVMGYTGKKAMQIKIAYIEAFNAMETELTGRAALPPTTPPSSDSPLTPDQQCTLQTIVKAKVEAIPKEQRSGGLYPQVWSRFNNHFRIAKYNQLPQSKLSEAVTYLMAMEIREDKKELPVSSTGLEEECLSLIHDIEEGQRATRMLFVSLNDRFASLSHRLGFEIQRVAKLGSRAAIPDALYHMGYESLSNTLGSKMEGLSVSSNPGYLLLGIARQLKGARA